MWVSGPTGMVYVLTDTHTHVDTHTMLPTSLKNKSYYRVQKPLWRTIWRFLKKLKIELPYDPAIPLLGIYPEKTLIQKDTWTSLLAQWLEICLPVQGTQVRALVWEDPTCRGAAKPVHHNY